ncbi:MAG: hypothetical protein A3F11_08230 [Gammaproteobacteria bacterium RIFCSPHIGHO2_12_FULL_37_14]|nr:MAG: hypothetical protein A3F11_08230 [Gammaproteobacteria bacterium RIFCSPHIGHO2_12_FULL_37_14]
MSVPRSNDKKEQPMENQIKDLSGGNPCGLCRAFRVPPPCRGHGAGGGGGGEGKAENKESKGVTPSEVMPVSMGKNTSSADAADKQDLAKVIMSTNRALHVKVGLMSIECIKLPNGLLIFRGNPGLTVEEKELLKQFLDAIKVEFNEFKLKLEERGGSTKDFTAVLKENELAIQINHPTYYAEFIQQLSRKNLLPDSRAAWHEVKEVEDTRNQTSRLNPFDISQGPKPRGWED